jgi:hypothetical protein
MSTAVKIAKWVQKKPMVLICFNEESSESLMSLRQGYEHLTIIKRHSDLQDFKLPTLCLMEIQEQGTSHCYLATATRKMAVSSFDSRLTLKKLRPIKPSSLTEVGENLSDVRMQRMFNKRIPGQGDSAHLSPKLSAYLIGALAADSENQAALDTALSQLPEIRQASNVNWAQEDAIHIAIETFGIRGNAIPDEVILKKGKTSGLSLIGSYLYEDNVVHADASQIPGFDVIATEVTGRAVFQKGGERLVIYTANKLPLEKMIGVDLIYINETRGNVVMVQYKMLEEDHKGAKLDWCFRQDKQLCDEMARMIIPAIGTTPTDYRLSPNPFFFKFVKRRIIDGSHQSFVVSLDHLNHILASPAAKGPRGGIRISYERLDGTYLREADLIGLIRSGYVGTHRTETGVLETIIDAVSKGNKAVVLAWQKKVNDLNS